MDGTSDRASRSRSRLRSISMKPHRHTRTTPSFEGLRPSSESASKAARGASAKTNTRCELALRRALWRTGLRYRLHVSTLHGRPDLVFPRARLAIFCDGDFWHGRDLEQRLERLGRGHNSTYWVAKVRRNVERDARHTKALEAEGWAVLRVWESEILRDPRHCADQIAAIVAARLAHRRHIGE